MTDQQNSPAAITRFAGEHEFLSNFFPSPVALDGVEYPTVEHAFQAAKTYDPQEREAIRSCGLPSMAKQIGRRVSLRSDWETVKTEVMRALLVQKFTIPELRRRLLNTGDAELIEGNTWNDRTWGCTRSKNGAWIGQNRLGRLLMEIRGQLKPE